MTLRAMKISRSMLKDGLGDDIILVTDHAFGVNPTPVEPIFKVLRMDDQEKIQVSTGDGSELGRLRKR